MNARSIAGPYRNGRGRETRMFKVADIKRGEEDSAGVRVTHVYAKVDTAYAVYRTDERVVVQSSDDPALGGDQRKLLAPLGPVRGEIDGLIDGWRKAACHRKDAGWW